MMQTDRSAGLLTILAGAENLNLGYGSGDKSLLIGTGQCWNNNPSIGSSICVCHGDERNSGDMFAVGASINHRHLATAIAVWTAS